MKLLNFGLKPDYGRLSTSSAAHSFFRCCSWRFFAAQLTFIVCFSARASASFVSRVQFENVNFLFHIFFWLFIRRHSGWKDWTCIKHNTCAPVYSRSKFKCWHNPVPVAYICAVEFNGKCNFHFRILLCRDATAKLRKEETKAFVNGFFMFSSDQKFKWTRTQIPLLDACANTRSIAPFEWKTLKILVNFRGVEIMQFYDVILWFSRQQLAMRYH